MKKITFLLVLSSIAYNAFCQKQLFSFEQVYNSFVAGKQINVIFHYSKCQLIADNQVKDKSPEAIGGFIVDSYEYFAPNSVRNKNAFISFSKTILIQNPLSDEDEYVLNYVKVRVSDDNKVRIVARYLNPISYKTIMDESFYTVINDGKNDGAAFFYEK